MFATKIHIKINEPEREYAQAVSLEHRKKFAQFFTPFPVAEFMSKWILGNKNLNTVLDPAFGLGIFARTIRKANKDCVIKGFDIDETILNEAIELFEDDANTMLFLKDYMFNDWGNRYDGIICNPPYFKLSESSFTNELDAFAIARHEIHLTLDQLMKQTSHLLKMKGKAYFVHRPDRLMEILETMRNNRIAPKKLQFIYPKQNKEANMILIEGIKDGKEDGFRVLPPLVVYNEEGEYSQKVKDVLYGEQ